MKVRGQTLVAAAATLSLVQCGMAATWINPAGGIWTASTANWSPTDIPNSNTEDAGIETDGTYTVTTGTLTVVRDVTVGTTTTSGTQTLQQNNSSGLALGNLTVGARGIYFQQYNQSGAGTVTVQSGGEYRSSNNTTRTIAKALNLQSGGTLTLSAGGGLSLPAFTHTLNGTITGAGALSTSGQPSITGSADIAGTGSFTLTNQVNWLSSMKISRNTGGNFAFLIANGQTVTIDGTYTQTTGTRSFGPQINNDSATVNGSGNISISADAGSALGLRFGGANGNNNGVGTMTFSGAGSLTLTSIAASGGYVDITASTLNLQRNTTISGDVRVTNGAGVVNVSGAGKTLAVEPAGVLTMASTFFDSRAINVNGGAKLNLNGGTISARNGTVNALNIGQTTAGTLELGAGTTSTFNRAASGSGTDPVLHLHANAITAAGSGSVLRLENSKFRVDSTTAANWGLDTAGDIRVGANVTLEALSDDLGNGVLPSSLGFSLKQLSFVDPGATFALTLAENTNNEGAGADRALYVETLDLSGLLAGRVLNLSGFSGAERVYYGTLVNPNGAAFDATKYIQVVVPEPTSLGALALVGGLLMGRRRVTRQ